MFFKVFPLIFKVLIFENSDYIAINKPVGIASHGGSGISIGIIEAIRNFGPRYRDCKLVHRLDKNTSGLVVIAKNNKTLFEEDFGSDDHIKISNKFLEKIRKTSKKFPVKFQKNRDTFGRRIVISI